MARPRVKEQDFVGKEAHLRHRDEEPAAILCTLTLDDPTSASGVKRYMLGREPIVTRDGTPPLELLKIGREQLKPYRTVTLTKGQVVDARQTFGVHAHFGGVGQLSHLQHWSPALRQHHRVGILF